MLLLVPNDPFRVRGPDEHFAEEAAAARDLGHDVAVVDHDALVAGDAVRGIRVVDASSDLVLYRGWMLDSRSYATFEGALAHQRSPLPDRTRVARLVRRRP